MSNQKIRIIKKHICCYCKQTFTRKTAYDSHILYCEKLKNTEHLIKSNNVMIINEEEKNNRKIPTNYQMATILESLVKEVKELREEVKELKELKKYVDKTKKQYSIIDWLNSPSFNNNPNIEFIETIKNFEITRKEMFNILDNDYIEGMYIIFQKIFPIETIDNHTIRCFQQNQNTFYIYKKEDNIYKWRILLDDDIRKAISIINNKLWYVFCQYKEENKEMIDKNDDIYQTYRGYTKKITGSLGYNKTAESNSRYILNLLFKYLKRHITNIIEYETTF
jgi:hypothetical protein